MTLYGLKGQQYQLDQKPFSSGGEGEIYRISGSNDRVVKVYQKGRTSKELEEKIKLMVNRPPSSSVLNKVAWPMDAVYDSTNSFCGFVMPKLDITAELGEVYVYPPRTGITYKQKLILAQNICAVIHEVHKTGYVFGDFNPRNIGINLNTGTVAFLDTDSYHIVIDKNSNKAYRCNVCAPGYAAPELLSKCSYHILAHPEDEQQAYAKTSLDTFTKETDNFALAIHIFKLLMNGFTPFNGIAENDSVSVASPGVGDVAVRRDNYCFKPGNKPQAVAVPPLNTLPRDIQALFTRAFIDGRDKPEKRPSAIEWHKALLSFENSLVICKRNPAHMFKKELKTCPWCEADDRYNVSIAPQLKQRTFSNPVTHQVAPTPIPAPVVSPVNTNVGVQNISSAQLNTFGTPASVTPTNAPSWRQKVNANRKIDVVEKWLNIIGWFFFLGSIVFVCWPLINTGSFHLDESNAYSIDIRLDSIITIASATFLCCVSSFKNKNIGKVVGTIWCSIFSFIAASARFVQQGKNMESATEAWKIFLMLLAISAVAIHLASKLGSILVLKQNNKQSAVKQKKQYSLFAIVILVLMVSSNFACIRLLLDLELFYSTIESYNLVLVAMWICPVIFFILDSGFVWYYASMTTCFTCLILCLAQNAELSILGWLVLAILGLIVIGRSAENSNGYDLSARLTGSMTVAFLVLFFTGGYVDLMVMDGGPAAVGEIARWMVVGPSIVMSVIAAGVTIEEILGI